VPHGRLRPSSSRAQLLGDVTLDGSFDSNRAPSIYVSIWNGKPQFRSALKPEPLPVLYIAAMLILTALFEILPDLEEFARTLRYRGRLVRRDGS
jgi:hypothetical protein